MRVGPLACTRAQDGARLSAPHVLVATPRHLVWDLDSLILLLLVSIICLWCVKIIFRLLGHTYTVTGKPQISSSWCQTYGTGVLSSVGGNN